MKRRKQEFGFIWEAICIVEGATCEVSVFSLERRKIWSASWKGDHSSGVYYRTSYRPNPWPKLTLSRAQVVSLAPFLNLLNSSTQSFFNTEQIL